MIRRQRAAIEKLKLDNAMLKAELALESRDKLGAPSLSSQQQISKLQDLAEIYSRKIDSEKHHVEELERAFTEATEHALDQRREMGGVNAVKENTQALAKQVKVLENRLDKALVKFNEALAHNKALREQIDNLRRERVVFEAIYKKLERELHDKKKEMANVIEISNIAYEARDQAQNEMAALRAQADKEQAAFEAEWRELGKMIEVDRSKPRETPKYEDEEKGRKMKMRASWMSRQEKSSTGNEERVQTFEEAFTKIQSATGITDIDQLVSNFIEAEDRNFSLFNYVNELHQEQEKMEEVVGEMRSEIERHRGQGLSSDHNRKKAILRDLETKVGTAAQKADQFEAKTSAAMRTVNAIKAGISSIFNKIGCNTTSSREVVGEEGITEGNLMQYLGLIEQRTNELLAAYAAAQAAQGADGAAIDQRLLMGVGPIAAAGSTTLNIEPPSTADEYVSDEESEEDVDDRPLTRDELTAKTMKTLIKREGRAGPRGRRKTGK